MRLICPNCSAQYEIDVTLIPDEGRDVQCSNCGHTWFELPPALSDASEAETVLPEPEEESPAPPPDDDLDDDDDGPSNAALAIAAASEDTEEDDEIYDTGEDAAL